MCCLLYFSVLLYVLGYASATTELPIYSPVKIALQNSDLVLDGSETMVTLTPYKTQEIQQWVIITNTDGSVTIENVATRLVIDLYYGNCTQNTHFNTYTYDGEQKQRLFLNGDNTITPACDSNFKVGVIHSNNIGLVPTNSEGSSTFVITSLED